MASSSSGRFTPNDFAYNGRVAMALIPSLATICAFGGQSVITLLALGAIAGYTMDLLQYRDGAYAASWLTMLATACAFSISIFTSLSVSLILQISLTFAMVLTLTLCALWASLQFKYFQMQHPAIALAFERFVITGSLPAATIMQTMGLSLFVDASDLPYYTATISCLLYCAFGRPLRSSFVAGKPAAAPKRKGHNTSASIANTGAGGPVQTRIDAALMAVLTAGMPALMYAAIHAEVLSRHMLHLYSLLLLGSVPLLVLALIPDGMWWLPGSASVQKLLRGSALVVALLGTVAGFEGRVVFHAFSDYIKLPPPWNWLLVTAALLGVAALTLAAQQGLLGGSLDITVAGSLLLLCTAAGSVAVGIPFHWLPAPLVAACGLALFFDSGSLREYIVFVAGAFMTGIWFVTHHFWFLDIVVGGLHLHALCKLALAALLPALMLPGLIYAGVPAAAVDVLIMVQATLLTIVEERLYVPSHSDWSGEAMYPAYLVIATSAVGLVMIRHLALHKHITPLGCWAGHAIYSAKTIMLLLPEASLVLPSVMVALSATAPVFMNSTSLATSSSGSSRSQQQPHTSPPSAAGGGRRRVRIPPAVGLMHAITILVCLALARFAVFDIAQFVLSSRPPEGLLLGVLLLAAAACLAPLVMTCYAGNMVVNRMLISVALGGCLLLVLQPPLPLRGGARCPRLPLALCPRLWDERHVPLHDSEDAEVWGTGLTRKEHWPRWLLFTALVLAVAAGAISNGPGAGIGTFSHHRAGSSIAATTKRLLIAGVTGFLVGSYVALEVVPHQPILQVLVLASCIIVVAFTCLLPLPSVRGPVTLPTLALGWLVVSGFTLLLQAQLPPPEAPIEMRRLFPDSHRAVEEDIQSTVRISLLAVTACQAALLSLALKLHVSATMRAQDVQLATENGHSGSGQAAPWLGMTSRNMSPMFCGVIPMSALSRWGTAMKLVSGSAGVLMQRLDTAGLGWAPSLGSACALGAYALCISINIQVTGGEPEGVFLAAPLLLLMQQDPLIAPGLTAARRYVLPFVATAASLLILPIIESIKMAVAGGELSSNVKAGNSHEAIIPLIGEQPTVGSAIQQIIVASLCAPAAFVLARAMWASKPLSSAMIVVGSVCCLMAQLLTPQTAVRYLAGVVLLSGFIHHLAVKHTKRMSAKII